MEEDKKRLFFAYIYHSPHLIGLSKPPEMILLHIEAVMIKAPNTYAKNASQH